MPGETLFSPSALAALTSRLGREIARDYPDGVLYVGVLKGSVCFLADLARATPCPCEIDFLALSSYGDGRARVKIAKDLDVDVSGRDVLVVADLVDTGLSLVYIRRLLAERGARSSEVCALLDRRSRRLVPVEVRYVGEVIGDEYVVGFGLDFNERYRNIPGIVVLGRGDLEPASGLGWQRA